MIHLLPSEHKQLLESDYLNRGYVDNDFEIDKEISNDNMNMNNTINNDNGVSDENKHWQEMINRGPWKALLCGQILSFTLACAGVVNSHLFHKYHVSSPTFQTLLVYVCLFVIYFPRCQHLNRKYCYDRKALIGYFFIALLDVEANYLTVLAYRYTSITSITLLDTFAIPSSMIFSTILLKMSYKHQHYVGAVVCIVGLVMSVGADFSSFQKDGQDDGVAIMSQKTYPAYHAVRGDFIAIFSSILYGLNDTIAELAVKTTKREEYLCMLGFFGAIISVVQVTIFEKEDLYQLFLTQAQDKVVLLIFVVGVLANTAFYCGVTLYLINSGAASLNLSILSSDFYAIIFSVLVQHFLPPTLYFVAFSFIIVGVTMYESVPDSSTSTI